MKSKLKSRLRLKIAVLTLIVFVCGFLLGFIAQRPKKEFTASAETTILSVDSLPFFRAYQNVVSGSPLQLNFNSSLVGSAISITFTITGSTTCTLRNFNNSSSTSLVSGDHFTLSTGDYIRFLNNSLNAASVTLTLDYYLPTTKLSAPVVTLDGSLLSWDIVPNAYMYSIFKDNEYLTNTTTTAVNLASSSSFGNGVYQVMAVADPEDSSFTNSDLSNSVSYSGGYNDELGTPILSYNRYILSWNFIVNADTFYIYYSFNGEDYELQAVVNSLSYNPSSNGYYYVVAHSFNDDYNNSPPSNIVNISNLTPTSSDNILHGILSACNDFLNLRLFGDNSITIGFLFSLGVTGLMLGIIIRLFFHG